MKKEEIEVSVVETKEGHTATAWCPICGTSETAVDNGYGAEHAKRTAIQKVLTHMFIVHKIKPNEAKGGDEDGESGSVIPD